jgi:hypothetical protein
MRRKVFFLLAGIMFLSMGSKAGDDGSKLYEQLRRKVMTVKDYTADVKIKINVTYIKIPQLSGVLYYKSPDKMRLERHGGLSILPKKKINLTLSNLIPAGNVVVIDMGDQLVGGKHARVLKVIPEDEKSDIVLTKIWVDEINLLAVRTETTTRSEGTIVLDLEYGKYIAYALPDKVTVFMDLKDYKLPKGVTMDYNNLPEAKQKADKNQKGTLEISYLKYAINKGVNDSVFIEK